MDGHYAPTAAPRTGANARAAHESKRSQRAVEWWGVPSCQQLRYGHERARLAGCGSVASRARAREQEVMQVHLSKEKSKTGSPTTFVTSFIKGSMSTRPLFWGSSNGW